MRLRRIDVQRLPGIDSPFHVDDLDHDVVIIVGPNGSGKSSLCRSIRAALWPDNGIPEHADVAITWSTEAGSLRSDVGRKVRWQVEGQDVGPPTLPDGHLARCFSLGLRDLMSTDGESERQLAERILFLMEGSNVRAVHAAFELKRRHGEKEVSALQQAEREYNRIRSEHRRLAEKEDQLRVREESLESAQRARDEIVRLEVARERAELQVELERAQKLMLDFPPGMNHLQGNERERLDQIERDIAEAESRCDEQRAAVVLAEKDMKACGLENGPAQEPALNAWLERARRLDGFERDLRAAREEEGIAGDAVGRWRLRLADDISTDPCSEIRPEDLDAVARWVRQAFRHAESRAAYESERESLLGEQEATRRNSLPLVVGAVLLALGVALALTVAPWFAGIAGLGLGLLAIEFYGGIGRRDGSARGERELQLRGVESRLKTLATAEEEIARQRDELRSRLGIDPGCTDLRLEELADSLSACREATSRRRAAEELRIRREQDVEDLLVEMRDFLREHGARDPRDAAEATTLLEDLKDRGARHALARSEKQTAENILFEQESRANQLRERIVALLREVVPDQSDVASAREQLTTRLRQRADWQTVCKRSEKLDWSIQQALARLGDRSDLCELTIDDAQRRIAVCQDEAASVTGLIKEIESIERQVSEARKSNTRELAQAARAVARQDLEARREEDLHSAAGRFLLDQVRQDYEARSHPEVFKRARRYFARFTENRYELRLDPDGAGFRAFDSARDESKELTELSDGERVQLLLAARIAFATHAEGGIVLPLFLDEALTSADPNRFRAVAENLLELARERRQIVYLTANGGDVEQWRQICRDRGRPDPHVVDLGSVRSLARAISHPEVLRVPERSEVPDPTGLTPEQYAMRLQVPPMDPHAPVDAMHMFHVLRPDLELLRRLLQGPRVSDVRGWRMHTRYGTAERFVSAGVRTRVDALVDLVQAFLDAWRVGRGRPVDRHALAESGAVSDTFLDKLASLSADLDGDAAELLAAIEARKDQRVHRFHTPKLEDLRYYLRDQGYLDPSATLDPEHLLARVLATIADPLSAEAMTTAEATHKIQELQSLLSRKTSASTETAAVQE